jgi:hypothetical protein
MAYTHAIKLGGRFTGLFVGSQGSGKTIAAASFPGPIMFYDFDGRMDPVRLFYPNRRDIQYKVVSAYDPPPGRTDVINFRQFCEEFEFFQQRCDFATIVIDSITSYTATVIRYQLNKKKKGKGRLLAGFIEVPTWDEFNGEAQAVVETIEIAKILPAHTIFTAHPIDKTEIIRVGPGAEDGEGKETVKRTQSITAFGNKTPSFVPNYFNEIYNFIKVGRGEGYDPQRIVITQAGDDVLCKTALPLPARLDITNKGLFKVLNEILTQHHLKLSESSAEIKQDVQEQAQAQAQV